MDNPFAEQEAKFRAYVRAHRTQAKEKAVQLFGSRLKELGLGEPDVYTLHSPMPFPHWPFQNGEGKRPITHVAGELIEDGVFTKVLVLTIDPANGYDVSPRNGLGRGERITDLSSHNEPLSINGAFFTPPLHYSIQERELGKYLAEARKDSEWWKRPPGFTLEGSYPERSVGFKPNALFWRRRIQEEQERDSHE